ncbi:LacI family DNA-binding transcriptional regulator [Niveispirillum sp.]|uniref:LacI family DNA-binding transcriptional regulator n=1 Tax=Niveispirillum sp. TaxID=1917217 RepID=UPI001B6BBFF4|nr:LacI family DNA-binding transcriptional regulator [Niveispirillum sp.]MBP7334867.1 LacI family DNA-binding transcriptional regulator [Niveispirillum sp.]
MPPRQRTNLKTLAEHLDLSITTVSRALKDGPEVKPETVARVKAAAQAMGYLPDAGGIYLRTGRTMKICSVFFAPAVADYGDAGFLAQVEGVSRTLENDHYNLIVLAQTASQSPLDAVRRVFQQRLADGVIFSRTMPLDERARFCLEHKFPFVCFGRTELHSPHAFVDHDDEGGVYDAVLRLAAEGHRRIALFNPAGGLTYAGLRLRGYQRALADLGLPWDRSLLVTADLSAWASQEAVRDLLVRDSKVTAILCANQLSMFGAMEAALDHGMDPARDGLRIVGFGGMPLRMPFEQGVTYYYQPQRRDGEELARHVLALLSGTPAEQLQTVLPYQRVDDLSQFRRDLRARAVAATP